MFMLRYKNIHNYSFLFFILYFVVQPVIQYEAFLGKIPDFLSLSLLITFLLFLLLLLNYLLNIKKSRYWVYDTYVLVALAIMLLYIFIDYFIYSHERTLFERNLIVLLYSGMFYLFGKNFNFINDYKRYFLFSYIVLILDKLFNLDETGLQIIVKYNIGASTDSTSLYLYLGDTFAIVSLLLITMVTNKYRQLFLFIISAAALYITSSRTSFYVFLVVSIVLILKEYKMSTKTLILFFILVLFGSLISYIDFEQIKDIRMISFLFTGEDASLYGRTQYLEKGLNAIANNLLIGDYGGQFFDDRLGAYMHNILSYYRQFGIIVVIMLIMIFYHIVKYYYKWFSNRYDNKVNYIFYISLFIIIESIFSRSYYSPLLFFAIGMFSNKNTIEQPNDKVVS